MKIGFLVMLLISLVHTDEISWLENFDDAKSKARNSGTVMMMLYTRPECKACRYMKKNVFTDEAVVSFINKYFTSLEIDLEEDEPIEGYKLFGTPTFYFFNSKGEKIDVLIGGAKADDFLIKLKKVYAKSK